MIKKYLRTAICAFTLGTLLGAGAIAAFAGSVASSWKPYGPVNGYSYKNAAVCLTNSQGATGGTYVETQNGGQAPSGYMGAEAVLYNATEGNKLVGQSSWLYNQGPSAGFAQYTQPNNYPDAYNSQGVTAAFDQSINNYHTFTTYSTPNINYP